MTTPRWALRMSLAGRLALASAAFGLLVAGGAIGLGCWALDGQLQSQGHAELRSRQELLNHVLAQWPDVASGATTEMGLRDMVAADEGLHLALQDPQTGRLLATTGRSMPAVEAVLAAVGDSAAPVDWKSADRRAFSSIVGQGIPADGKPVRYLLSRDRQHDQRILAGFLRASLTSLPLVLGLVVLGVWLITRTSLAPIRRFNLLAAAIGTNTLDKRLSLDGLPCELQEPAHEFNAMLDRIDDGYQRLQDFSADLAHEMRTPVATLLGRSQMVLSRERDAQALREAMEQNIEELERLSRLISDMLFIATRGQQGRSGAVGEPVALASEASCVVDYLGLVADERQVAIAVEGDAHIRAERTLVQRAITNLLTNAIRHADSGSTVQVRIEAGKTGASVAVSNQGAPIPPQAMDRLFDRFYRANPARARNDGGAGLGLAIVRSIMAAHGGDVRADSSGGRTTFTLVFPRELQAG